MTSRDEDLKSSVIEGATMMGNSLWDVISLAASAATGSKNYQKKLAEFEARQEAYRRQNLRNLAFMLILFVLGAVAVLVWLST
jgi:hypothetical protein